MTKTIPKTNAHNTAKHLQYIIVCMYLIHGRQALSKQYKHY